jgi:uncharacterized protein YcbX
MRGEECDELFLAFSGVYGDRLYAFHNSKGPAVFPYRTGRDDADILTYRPRFRNPDRASRPANLAPGARATPGLTALSAAPADLAVDVLTPGGESWSIDDPRLAQALAAGAGDGATLALMRSDRAMTDCRPVSLFSIQSVSALGDEMGEALDKRRFRANIYADLGNAPGFAENAFVGHRLRIGPDVEITITGLDGRCKMITLDPDTGAAKPEVLAHVTKAHEAKAGIYGAVLSEGIIRRGDEIDLLD